MLRHRFRPRTASHINTCPQKRPVASRMRAPSKASSAPRTGPQGLRLMLSRLQKRAALSTVIHLSLATNPHGLRCPRCPHRHLLQPTSHIDASSSYPPCPQPCTGRIPRTQQRTWTIASLTMPPMNVKDVNTTPTRAKIMASSCIATSKGGGQASLEPHSCWRQGQPHEGKPQTGGGRNNNPPESIRVESIRPRSQGGID